MNKKFLSAILFGALALASTGSFVSCKDYDDDIKNLQTQINASSKDLADKVSALNTAISAAQSAAEAKAAAAQTAADKALKLAETAVSAEDLEKKLNDLAAKCATKDEADAIKALAEAAATKTELAEAVKAVEAKIDAAVAETAAAKADIAALQEKVAEVEAAIAKAAKQEDLNTLATKVAALEAQLKTLSDGKTMITSVSLVEAYCYNYYVDKDYYWHSNTHQGANLGEGSNLNLGFKSVVEQTTVFGKGLPGEIKFEAGKAHSLQTSTIVVRVNPANATLTKEDVKLVNSKGEVLDVVEVADVKPYEGLITKASSNTGLWNISVKVKDNVSMEDLKKATTVENKKKEEGYDKICYAVAIGNAERSVVSTYDLTAAPETYYPLSYLDFYASNKDAELKNVWDIHNRSARAEDGTTTRKEELTWYKINEKSVVPATIENIVKKTKDETYKNVVFDWNDEDKPNQLWDYRQDKNLLAVEVNKPIDLYVAWDKDNKKVANEIAGFYVAYDTINAVESAPSEWNAWTSYEVDNLNKVQAGNTGSITIKSEKANGDVIGFRLYAVNLDGTLLDPDGKAFYVYVGNATAFGVVPQQPIVATKKLGSKSDTDFLADFKAAMADVKNSEYKAAGWTNTKAEEVKDKAGNNIAPKSLFDVWVKYNNADMKVTATGAGENEIAITDIDLSKVTKVWYVMPDARQFIDNGVYEQKMEIKKTVGTGSAATDVLVKTITVSFKKIMPSEAPVVKYITGQNSELLLAPIANPTTLADFGSANIAEKAAINLNNIYYELSRSDANSIKFSADKSKWEDDDEAYSKAVTGKNGAATNLEIANNNVDAFKAITDGSEHTIKFSAFYPAVSCVYSEDGDDLVVKDFTTKATTDFTVTYNCWHKFTKWEWTKKTGFATEVNGEDVVIKDEFAPNLQWHTAGTVIIWKATCIEAKSSKNSEIFNTTFDKYAFAKVIKLEDQKNIWLEDVVDPDQKNNYFTPTWDDEKGFVFTKTQDSSNPASDVDQILKMKVTDVFGHEVVLELGKVKVLRQK